MGNWQQRPTPSMVVVNVAKSAVPAMRAEIRRHILEGSFSEELKEVMFTLYRDLKEE